MKNLTYLFIKIILTISLVFTLTNCSKQDINSITVHNPLENPENGPAAGNPDGNTPIPNRG